MKRALLIGLFLIVAGFLLLAGGGEESSVTYVTAPVTRGDIVTTTTSTGSIEAVVTVEVGSQLSGQVEELFVDFNDEVKKGQPIAQLDQQSFDAEVREATAALSIAEAGVRMQDAAIERARSSVSRAKAQSKILEAKTENARLALAKAERALGRTGELRRKGAIASSALEDAQTARDTAAVDLRAAEAEQAVHEQDIAIAAADLAQAEATRANAEGVVLQKQAVLEQAKVRLERTVVRSPIDGVVIGRNIDRGQTVAASLEAPTLFTIAQDLRRMEVHAKIDEADIGRIRLGQQAVFSVDSYPRRLFRGTVTQIRKSPQATKNVVVYTVLISAENPELALLPGMTAVTQIVVAQASGVLKVPNAALRFRPQDGATQGGGAGEAGKGVPATVWIKGEGDGLAPVRIGTGASDATATELVSGSLKEGEIVVVGQRRSAASRSFLGLRLGL